MPRGSYPSWLAGRPLWWLGRRAKRGLPRACRPLTVIGESRLRTGFDEGALVFGARGGS